ncbi:MAG TPA: GNAT family N-acetyltransferase [Anaerolineales bacterium]|nr:GNAT family N-acetyltransferase [Anaerolineales bacterium]
MDGAQAMSAERFQVITPSHADFRNLVRGLTREVWPEFMLHSPVANELWHELLDRFPEYQLALLDTKEQRVAGMANSFPLRWQDRLENLPENGWDWAFQEAVKNHKQGLTPTHHCAIQIILRANYQGQGLASAMVEWVRAVTKSQGLQSLIIPLRPSEKHKYPLVSLDNYITWQNEQGLPFDAWLRVHVKAGCRIVKVCHSSKLIRGTCAEWSQWTGLQFPQNGEYIIPGALNPIEMNVEKDEGLYIEPNVWIVHGAG